MWVRFARDFDFSPAAHGGRVTIAYKAGTVANVTRECERKAGDRAVRTAGAGQAAAAGGRETQAPGEAPLSVLPDAGASHGSRPSFGPPTRGETGGGGVGDAG